MEDGVQTLSGLIQSQRHSNRPFVVAIDGGSGAGKTMLAASLAAELNGVIIPSDDFYAAHIPNADWERWTPAERYTHVIDWRRLRTDALEPLIAGRPARWHPFDFTQPQPDGTYPLQIERVERPFAEVILLEGAYSTRPELADLIQLKVLVDVPIHIRHERLAQREAAEFLAGWHARWDAVEDYYFSDIRPLSSFDFIVNL